MPNGMNVLFRIKRSKNFTARIATIHDPTNPTPSTEYSKGENAKLLFTRSKIVAASIVGTARRNENSTAVFRFVPKKSAAIIVAADRETPGITAIDWQRPIRTAFFVLIFSILSTWCSFSLYSSSKMISASPPTKSDKSVT